MGLFQLIDNRAFLNTIAREKSGFLLENYLCENDCLCKIYPQINVASLPLTEEVLVPGHHHKFTVEPRIHIALDKKANQI